MFKKTMKFDNLDGEEVQQTFYFNFNKKEIIELMQFGRIQSHTDVTREAIPLEEAMKKLNTSVEESGLSEIENSRQAYNIFQDLLLDAYGVKGEDNVSFNKTPELRHYWSTHVAFPELVFEFLENPALAAEFVEKCLPPRLVAQAKTQMQKESQGQLSSESLSEMVTEADRRQQDPATRIEPGGSEPTGVSQLADHIKKEDAPAGQEGPMPVAPAEGGGVKAKEPEELTEQEIMEMDDIAFKKLDPRRLSPMQLQAAFRRKL